MKCFEKIALVAAILACCTALPETEESGPKTTGNFEGIYQGVRQALFDISGPTKIDNLRKQLEELNAQIATRTKKLEELQAENALYTKELDFESQLPKIVETTKDIAAKVFSNKKNNVEVYGLSKSILRMRNEIDKNAVYYDQNTDAYPDMQELEVEGITDRKFFISNSEVSYIIAKSECQAFGLEIVTFNSKDEAKSFLQALKTFEDFAWVGIERSGDEFKNTDGVVVDLPWRKGEPNNWENSDENCVSPSVNFYGYNDVPCDKKIRYVCQKDV